GLGRSGQAPRFLFQRREPTQIAAAGRASPPLRHTGAWLRAIRHRRRRDDLAPEAVVQALSSPVPDVAAPSRVGIPRLSGRCEARAADGTPWYDGGQGGYRRSRGSVIAAARSRKRSVALKLTVVARQLRITFDQSVEASGLTRAQWT